MKTYLNIGCGSRYHASWTNVDFVSTGKDVRAHNLLEGIPSQDESFEVVYHSHVLEHFSKTDGQKLIEECYRVLKPKGILRIAVPDLEQIVREYLKNLELSLQNNKEAQKNYEWIMLEMYDQVVRSKSGGDMAQYIFQKEIPNEEYVFTRLGEEAHNLRKSYLDSLNQAQKAVNTVDDKRSFFRKALSFLKGKVKNYLFKDEINFYEKKRNFTTLGKFRLGGEIHQWMYDRYSLSKLLEDIGFKNIEVKTAFESNIPNWSEYGLEKKDAVIFKPDSLFIEATK
jgi:predicted SAM-dependent methyltransferase